MGNLMSRNGVWLNRPRTLSRANLTRVIQQLSLRRYVFCMIETTSTLVSIVLIQKAKRELSSMIWPEIFTTETAIPSTSYSIRLTMIATGLLLERIPKEPGVTCKPVQMVPAIIRIGTGSGM